MKRIRGRTHRQFLTGCGPRVGLDTPNSLYVVGNTTKRGCGLAAYYRLWKAARILGDGEDDRDGNDIRKPG